ncbi:MAG: type II toxin-antitoxin system death-on-curing family toxin [Candidatus Micrarchaeia archaeon]
MKIKYLNAKQVIEINKKTTRDSNDPFAVENKGNLEHAINAVKYKYEGKEDALFLKAAYWLDMFANKGHVFAEGNKRTAITSTIAALELNKYVIDTENQDELVEFVLEVSKGNNSLRNTKKWLEQRIKKRSQTR